MSKLTNLMRKELKELMSIESVLSMLIVVVMFVGLGFMIGQQTESISEPPRFGLLNYDAPEDGILDYSNIALEGIYEYYEVVFGITSEELDGYMVTISPEDIEEGDQLISKMQDLGLTSALVIDSEFSNSISGSVPGGLRAYYITEGTGMLSGIDSGVTSSMAGIMNRVVSAHLIDDIGGKPAFVSNPVLLTGNDNFTYINGKLVQGVTPMEISNAMMTQTMMTPIVIMIVIMVVGSIVISSMGNEKENKTLETLLTLPVKRTTIVGSKILASAIMGIIYGAVYMAGMYIYMGSMTRSIGGVNLADFGLVMGPADWMITMFVMFLAIMCALGLCMILGAFVKNYKSAQTMTLPISVLAIIPMFIFMFSDWNSLGMGMQTVMFLIPFSHPMMVMQNLMFGNYLVVIAGLVYNAAFALATVLITVRLYNSDILLVGFGGTKLGRALAKYKKAD